MNKQDSRIYNYLKAKGKINPLQAWRHCGVYRLSASIHRLRHEHNIEIDMERVDVKNQFDETCKVGEYRLKAYEQFGLRYIE